METATLTQSLERLKTLPENEAETILRLIDEAYLARLNEEAALLNAQTLVLSFLNDDPELYSEADLIEKYR